MTQEEFDKAPLLDQILYDTTGMLVENHLSIAEAMDKYHQAKLKLLVIADVSSSFTKDEVINILQKRADNAFHKFHEYERNEILKAIDIITRLMPPSSFPDW
jgi:hypothetical protein